MSQSFYRSNSNNNDCAQIPKRSHSRLWLLVILGVVVIVYGHVEVIIAREYAPETLLLRLGDIGSNVAAVRNQCSANITTSSGTEYSKALRQLDSIYDYLDPAFFTVSVESGYYILQTDWQDYSGDYKIEVTCYSSDETLLFERVISSEGQLGCFIQEKGRLLIC